MVSIVLIPYKYIETSTCRLSVFLEPIDPSRKKHPVNNLEVLTLSYKVGSMNVMV